MSVIGSERGSYKGDPARSYLDVTKPVFEAIEDYGTESTANASAVTLTDAPAEPGADAPAPSTTQTTSGSMTSCRTARTRTTQTATVSRPCTTLRPLAT